jgi:exoribonuclease R
MRRSVGSTFSPLQLPPNKFESLPPPYIFTPIMLQTKDYKHFRVGELEFEGAALASRALPGDTVEVENGRVVSITDYAQHPPLVGTLELAAKIRYGMTSRGAPMYKFTPFSEAYPPFFVGCAQKDVSRNVLALVAFMHWEEGATCPRGNLLQVFGPTGDITTEELALLIHNAPTRWKKFDPDTIVEPPAGPSTVQEDHTFHVDPPGCRDIDDAITLTTIGPYEIEVKIHIADVASWLVANPALAPVAEKISQTLYLDGVAVVPMFPHELSEGSLSLLPGQLRRAWTLTFCWDTDVRDVRGDVQWSLETIRVGHSYTYDSFYDSPYAPALRKVASGLAGGPLDDSHEWIEQMMLFYNREAAKLLRQHGVGVLRRHPAPDMERLTAYETIGLPAAQLAFKAGEYCPADAADTEHWGLGQSVYCHASSPIRRWSDCVNQLAIRRLLLAKEDPPLPVPNTASMNAGSKRAKAYERDVAFVRALLTGPKQLHAIVASPTKLWIPDWNRLVRCQCDHFPCGTHIKANIYCDAKQRNWKRRLVIRTESM